MSFFDEMLDGLPYPDRITVYRPGEMTQDPDTGVVTAGVPTTVLTSRCDVQSDRYLMRRDVDGDIHHDADAVVWMPSDTQLHLLRSGDLVTIEEEQLVREARILEVDLYNRNVVVELT